VSPQGPQVQNSAYGLLEPTPTPIRILSRSSIGDNTYIPARGKDLAYDGSGNRVLLRSSTGSGTSITTYPFGLEEHLYDATGSTLGNTYYYTLGGRLIGALTGANTLSTQFFLTDALGSVLATFNATAGSAAVLGNQVYGPYGNQRYTAGPMGTAKVTRASMPIPAGWIITTHATTIR
jgi:hypothetical protein